MFWKWVTDVTEFHVRGNTLYLSAVMDRYNGEIVVDEMQRRPPFPLVENRLRKALARLSGQHTPMHSDQGGKTRCPPIGVYWPCEA